MNDSSFPSSPSGRGVGDEGPRAKIALPSRLLEFARVLRMEETEPEFLLWHLLRGRRFMGLKFRRQHPLPPYVLDFYCSELKLAIELDGGQHNEKPAVDDDERRERFIKDKGIEVVRYWNHDLMQRTESVLADLYWRALSMQRPSPGAARHPLPEGEGARLGNDSMSSPAPPIAKSGMAGVGIQAAEPYCQGTAASNKQGVGHQGPQP